VRCREKGRGGNPGSKAIMAMTCLAQRLKGGGGEGCKGGSEGREAWKWRKSESLQR